MRGFRAIGLQELSPMENSSSRSRLGISSSFSDNMWSEESTNSGQRGAAGQGGAAEVTTGEAWMRRKYEGVGGRGQSISECSWKETLGVLHSAHSAL